MRYGVVRAEKILFRLALVSPVSLELQHVSGGCNQNNTVYMPLDVLEWVSWDES